MNDTKNEKQGQAQSQHHSAPADAVTPFFTWNQLWRSEAQRVLDLTSSATERSFSEWERTVSEVSRLQHAQTKLWHDATRALFAGARTIVG